MGAQSVDEAIFIDIQYNVVNYPNVIIENDYSNCNSYIKTKTMSERFFCVLLHLYEFGSAAVWSGLYIISLPSSSNFYVSTNKIMFSTTFRRILLLRSNQIFNMFMSPCTIEVVDSFFVLLILSCDFFPFFRDKLVVD